jgi:hypothetical protein
MVKLMVFNLWPGGQYLLDQKDACDANRFLPTVIGSRGILDVCIMASKLTYEPDQSFVESVVTNDWKVRTFVQP